MRCCLTFDKNDCVQSVLYMLIVGAIEHTPEIKPMIRVQLKFHGDVITTSTEGIPSTLN